MAVVRLGLGQLGAALRENASRVDAFVHLAAAQAAVTAAHEMASRAPVAFGDLRGSIHAEVTATGGRAVADAPHAAAVEVGSRPHWVPLDALVRWVKLRGAQGLSGKGLSGSTTKAHAARIGSSLAAMRIHSADDMKKIARAAKSAATRSLREDLGADFAKSLRRKNTSGFRYSPDVQGAIDNAMAKSGAAGEAARLRKMAKTGSTAINAPELIAKSIQRAIAKRGTKPHWFARASLPLGFAALDRYVRNALKEV